MARNREFDTGKVLDKAIGLFWHKGFNGTSTQEMIDEFGISKSSMYGAFGDKMNLFIAALEKYRNEIADDTTARLQHCSSIRKEIKDILSSIVKKSLADKDHKGCFIVNSCIELAPHNEAIADIVIDHRKKMEKVFEAAIKRGVKNREFSATINPEGISMIICNTINGIQVDAKYLRSKKHFDNVINAVLGLLK